MVQQTRARQSVEVLNVAADNKSCITIFLKIVLQENLLTNKVESGRILHVVKIKQSIHSHPDA